MPKLSISEAPFDVDSLQESTWLTIALRVTPLGALIRQLQGRPNEA